jgi:S-adenosylmethionine hydrolase
VVDDTVRPVVLATDFGLEGPYVGQMQAVVLRHAPAAQVINLFADLPTCNPRAAAHLLAAYAPSFDPGTVFLCVVDPGVGGPRPAAVIRADGRWFVGPDNGLFDVLAARSDALAGWHLPPPGAAASATFHGRDVFAPAAARLARGEMPAATPVDDPRARLPVGAADDLWEIVYIDRFGNAMTGVRADSVPDPETRLLVGDRRVGRASTYSDVPVGDGFWYRNSNGLVELAVNRGRAAEVLGLHVGQAVASD